MKRSFLGGFPPLPGMPRPQVTSFLLHLSALSMRHIPETLCLILSFLIYDEIFMEKVLHARS